MAASDPVTNDRPATSPWPGTTAVPRPTIGSIAVDGRGPVHRVAVAEVGRVAVLEQVAGAQDVRVGDRDHDVVVGVAAAEVGQPDLAPAEVEGRAVGEHPVRRIEADLGELVGEARGLGEDPGQLALAGALDHRPAALVTPDHRRPEHLVAEGVVVVAVRVDDDPDPRRAEVAQVVQHLARLGRGAPGVDDERRLPVAGEHRDDVLVVEPVAPHEHAVADLGPAGRLGGRRHGGDASRRAGPRGRGVARATTLPAVRES